MKFEGFLTYKTSQLLPYIWLQFYKILAYKITFSSKLFKETNGLWCLLVFHGYDTLK